MFSEKHAYGFIIKQNHRIPQSNSLSKIKNRDLYKAFTKQLISKRYLDIQPGSGSIVELSNREILSYREVLWPEASTNYLW